MKNRNFNQIGILITIALNRQKYAIPIITYSMQIHCNSSQLAKKNNLRLEVYWIDYANYFHEYYLPEFSIPENF